MDRCYTKHSFTGKVAVLKNTYFPVDKPTQRHILNDHFHKEHKDSNLTSFQDCYKLFYLGKIDYTEDVSSWNDALLDLEEKWCLKLEPSLWKTGRRNYKGPRLSQRINAFNGRERAPINSIERSISLASTHTSTPVAYGRYSRDGYSPRDRSSSIARFNSGESQAESGVGSSSSSLQSSVNIRNDNEMIVDDDSDSEEYLIQESPGVVEYIEKKNRVRRRLLD